MKRLTLVLPLAFALALFACPGGTDPDPGNDDAGQKPPDAGQPDAGRTDSGQPDAGPTDGGSPDAGPTRPRAFNAADWQDEVIYLVMLDRFSDGSTANNLAGTDKTQPNSFHGGDLVGLTNRLDYIQSLGATTIWITPLYRQIGPLGGSAYGYHGYWFEDPKAIDPHFGTGEELRALLSAAHARGLKVILDLVANHSGYGATVYRNNPAWFHDSNDCAAAGSVSSKDEVCSLAGLPDFDQDVPAASAYLKDQLKYWFNTYDFDGARMDTAKHVPRSFWQSFFTEVRAGTGMTGGLPRRDLFFVGEAFITDDRTRLGRYQTDGFHSVFDFPLRSAVISTFAKGGSVDAVAQALQLDNAFPNPSFLSPMADNHDVTRIASETIGGTGEEARARQLLAFDFIFTVRGIPQLYYGNELGMLGGQDPDNRRDMPDWAWTAAGRASITTAAGFLPGPAQTFNHLATLAALRKAHPALHRGSYVELWRQNGVGPNVLSYFRGDEASGDRLIIGINNDSYPSDVMTIGLDYVPEPDRAAMPDGQVLEDLLGGAPTTVTRGQWRVNLPALTAKIMRPRAPSATRSAVSVSVTGANPAAGQNVYLVGSIPELGTWDPRLAVKLTPSGAAFTGTLRYLEQGTSFEYRFIKIDGSGNVVWESEPNRAFTVPATPTSTLGATWR
ncbi:MAG TPA: alpha-amylase family glycosyl hydrolase [Myxococcaceae bacterium]|nr:alpha-amylase family glycosyl hydrolase [Myxococcaceae bacterium]